jgi:general secretion pathway protein E
MSTPNLPYSFAKQKGVLLHMEGDVLSVWYKGVLSTPTLLELQRFLQRDFQLKKISNEEFQQALTRAYESKSSDAMQLAADMGDDTDLISLLHEMPKHEDLLEAQDDAPIIRLLNALFTEALKLSASDIHVETFEDTLAVRFRIDGVLREMIKPQRVLAPMIVSRLKVMSKLDIAEKRLPQDGRIALHIAGHNVDVRVSTLPTNHGERIVLRLLDQKNAQLNLTSLGMSDPDLKIMEALIAKPHGIILVTGPTGSGKTTTLYAALTQLNQTTRNILTIEDPVEYDLTGIGQTQVNPKIDLTFAKGLRAILRQDPDVVMVGEIRDVDTMQIAIQASLTGHLVLSTLHTNSAVGAITRLNDMGVEPFLLSSSLLGILAQRLVRVLCTHCKEAVTPDAAQCKLLAEVPHPNPPPRSSAREGIALSNPPLLAGEGRVGVIYQAKGCEHCGFTGYRGRTGIYEMLPIDEALRVMIHDKVGEHILDHYARERWLSIQQDGLRKVLLGETTLEEVLRVTSVET